VHQLDGCLIAIDTHETATDNEKDLYTKVDHEEEEEDEHDFLVVVTHGSNQDSSLGSKKYSHISRVVLVANVKRQGFWSTLLSMTTIPQNVHLEWKHTCRRPDLHLVSEDSA
jgi:hypothetical protein